MILIKGVEGNVLNRMVTQSINPWVSGPGEVLGGNFI